MELINGENVVIHRNEDGHAHIHVFRNPAEVQQFQTDILIGKAFEKLWQCKLREFWCTCWEMVKVFIPRNQFGPEPQGWQHGILIVYLIIATVVMVGTMTFLFTKDTILHSFSRNGTFREIGFVFWLIWYLSNTV